MRLAYGTVVELDLSGALHQYRIKLTTGQLSPWMPKCDMVSGESVSNHPLSLGTQVAALILDSEGLILGTINSTRYPAVSDADTLKRTVFKDGAVIEYDAQSHQLNAVLPSGATTHLTSDGGVTVDGDTTINGNLTVNGNASITGSADIGGDTFIGGNLTLSGNGTVGGNFSISGVCAVGGLAAVGGGAVSASGGMSMTGGDITVDGISVKTHTHPGDSGGTTGAAQ